MATGDKRPPKDPRVILRKLTNLITHPITECETERQLNYLRNYLQETTYAFFLPDISYNIRLFEALAKKKDSKFKEQLKKLLLLSATPPIQFKASDKIVYERDLQEYFAVLGYLMVCLQDEDLSKIILDSLINLLQRKSPVSLYCVPLSVCLKAARSSRLLEISAALMEVISDDLYLKLLKVTIPLCENDAEAAQTLLKENAIQFLLQRLDPLWREQTTKQNRKCASITDDIPHFEDTTYIIWCILSSLKKNQDVDEYIPSIKALWGLRHALSWSIVSSVRKHHRNSIFGIALRLINIFPHMEFTPSGLAEDIIVGVMKVMTINDELSTDDVDFQFEKILLSFLFHYKCSCRNLLIQNYKLIQVIILFLNVQKSIPIEIQQHNELQKILLITIPKLIPDPTFADSISSEGFFRIAKLLNQDLKRPCHICHLQAVLTCVNDILFMDIESITNVLLDFHAYETVLAICEQQVRVEILGKVHQQCLILIFCIMSKLCKKATSCEVDLCILGLNRVIRPLEVDPLIDTNLIVCIIDFLWTFVICDRQLLNEFNLKNGIYLLLDLTQFCRFPVKVMALGMLADICQYSESIPYLITWRKHGQKILPMLMKLFRSESEKNYKDNTTALVVYCRPKISTLVYFLKSTYKSKVIDANENYKLYSSEELEADDKLTMLFAEHYLSLQLCDTWMILVKKLRKDDVKITESDKQLLLTTVRNIHNWRIYLQRVAQTILEDETNKEEIQELCTYNAIKEARLSDALDALKDLEMVTVCTEKMFKLGRQIRTTNAVEMIRYSSTNYHRTVGNIPFTNVYNQTIDIQSDAIHTETASIPNSAVSIGDSTPDLDLDDDSFLSLNSGKLLC